MIRALDCFGGWRRARDEERQFVSGVVAEPQVFKRGPRGVERFHRQADFHEAGRGDVELLRVLPFGGQCGVNRERNQAT